MKVQVQLFSIGTPYIYLKKLVLRHKNLRYFHFENEIQDGSL